MRLGEVRSGLVGSLRRRTPARLLAAVFLSAAEIPYAAAQQTSETPEPYANTVTVNDTTATEPAAKPAEPARPPGNRIMEEIIITAQKREENLQDVPISVSAFSADTLDAQGVTTPQDLSKITPGLQYESLAGYSIVYLRGVGSDAFILTADSSVATYIDGVYFPFLHSLAQSLDAVERIEVLKGPQGTLFGRNTTGGAINVITRKPSQTPSGSVYVNSDRFEEYRVRGFYTAPLNDQLAWSVSATTRRGELPFKFAKDSPVQKLPEEEDKGARLKLLWSPSEDFDVLASAFKLKQNGAGTTVYQQADPKPLGAALGMRAETQDYVIATDFNDFIDLSNQVLSMNINWRPEPFDVRLLGSKQDIHSIAALDFDATKQAIASLGADQYAHVKTAELQFVSKPGGWLSDWLEWIAGGYLLDSSAGYKKLDAFVGSVVPPNLYPPGSLNLFQTLLDPVAIPFPVDINAIIRANLDTFTYAGFFQGNVPIVDWLSLTIGGRYQFERRELTKSDIYVVLPGPVNADPKVLSRHGDPVETTNFSPKVSLNFKFAEDSLLFLSWTQGFKSGTYNAINILTAPQFVKPEKTTATELGIKGNFLGGDIRYSAAVFQNKIENLQTQFVALESGGVVTFENAAQATVRGADFDLKWALTQRLAMTASGCYLHGRFDSYPSGSGFDQTTGVFFSNRDFSGNQTVRSPKFSGVVNLNYAFPLGDSMLEVGSGVYYNSGYYVDNQNATSQPEYHLINAQISYLYTPWSLRFTISGNNINNATYYYSKLPTDFGLNVHQAPPAVYGAHINWDF